METVDTLRAVIGEHGTTTIIYRGGSAPGTARAIAPIAIEGSKLVARCLETNSRKTFMLDKVEIAGADAIIPRPHRVRDDVSRLRDLSKMTLEVWFQFIQGRISRFGWSVEIGDDAIVVTNDERRHWLAYDPRINGAYVDADGNQCEAPMSARPWHVDGRLFTHKERAFAAFEDAVLMHR